MANKPNDITWKQYVARLEQEIKNRPDSDSFLISSKTVNGEMTTFRPISELRDELNMARNFAANESAAESSCFLSDCAL